MTREQLIERVLALPRAEQEDLLAALVDRLDAPDPHEGLSREEFQALVLARAEAALSGDEPGVAWAEVRAELRSDAD
ncbi:MAG: hypothetical protein AAGH15_01495 [Myxococcota bacterium]